MLGWCNPASLHRKRHSEGVEYESIEKKRPEYQMLLFFWPLSCSYYLSCSPLNHTMWTRPTSPLSRLVNSSESLVGVVFSCLKRSNYTLLCWGTQCWAVIAGSISDFSALCPTKLPSHSTFRRTSLGNWTLIIIIVVFLTRVRWEDRYLTYVCRINGTLQWLDVSSP